MKTIVALLVALVSMQALGAELPKWMAGSWVEEKPDSRTEEHWTTADGGMMMGMGKTVTKKRTTFEFIRIIETDGTLEYLAMPQARPETTFRLKSSTDSRVVFENLEHDFPQRVLYWRDGEKLCGRIEGLLKGKLESEDWCYTRMK